MEAIETTQHGETPPIPDANLAGPSAASPDAAAVTGWLLEGRFFTTDVNGAITTWGGRAAEAFGWSRKDVLGSNFVETLIAREAQEAEGRRLAKVLGGDCDLPTGVGEATAAATMGHAPLSATFAIVPIQIAVGYEFNSLLQEITSRASSAASLAELKARHEAVCKLIDDALSGRDKPESGSDEGPRLAGVLIIFDAVAEGAPSSAPVDNVVSIGDAASVDESRAQLDLARHEAEDARVELRSIEGQLDEARREAQRARGEADVARQEAADARDALAIAQREAERARGTLEDARREGEEARVAAEAGRIRLDEVAREAQNIRSQLLEAREQGRGGVEGLQKGLREAREEAGRLAGELADAGQELARQAGELDAARRRADAAQLELGAARSAESTARVELADARREIDAAVRHREQLESQFRSELEAARAELALATDRATTAEAEIEAARAESALALDRTSSAEAELEAARAESALATDRATSAEAELADARTAGGRLEQTEAELEEARRLLAEAALREAEAQAIGAAAADSAAGRKRLAFDEAPIAAVLAAPDGRILQVNQALCDTLGYDEERLLAAEAPAVVHPDDVDARRELAQRIQRGDQTAARSLRRYLHADGHVITMHESVSLVRDPEAGDPLMFIFQLEEAHAGEHGDHVMLDVDLASDEPGSGTQELVPVHGEGDPLSPERLRRAIAEESFALHCQPVLDLRTNEVAQFELLIRLVADDGRLILPQAFLGPARSAGLAQEIDRWVVRRALRLLADDPSGKHSLEVNLSPEAIHDPDLPTLIEEELAATAIDPGRLILEVTGQAATESLVETRALAGRLRALGCRFALDDFRSTFGSLRILKDLPLDYLKLDGELVESLTESRTSQLIVRALVEVAEGTATKTVAVFVSDELTLGLLRQQGVDYAQGYAVGRPQPVGEIWPDARAALPPG